MAVYPGSIVTFTTKRDLVDTVDAGHPNSIQREVVALEVALGVNPTQSVTSTPASYSGAAQDFASVGARLANIEHGLTADVHTQYLRKVGGDTIQSTLGTVGLKFRPVSGQTANSTEWTDTSGVVQTYVDPAGRLRIAGGNVPLSAANAASTVTSLAAGQASVVGTSSNYARENHAHGLPGADAAAGTASFRTLGTGALQAAPGNHGHASLDLTTYTEAQASVAAASATTTLNCLTGTYFEITLTASTTLQFSNVPASGKVYSATLIFVQDVTGGRVVTWPANTKWSGGSAPTQETSANSVSIYSLFTADAGATWYAFLSGKGMA